ncbi:hypothetical protein V8E53_012581 [Lactarius tabidus]
MSTPSSSSAAAASNPSNASPNFDVALDDFKTRTGHDLSSHSFAAVIDSCATPKAILYEYRKQVRKNYNQYRKGDSRLMNALKPIVHGLYTMSQSETTKLPGKLIFTAIGILLAEAKGVLQSYSDLVDLFESIRGSLERRKPQPGLRATPEIMEIRRKIMYEIITVLALAAGEMMQRRRQQSAGEFEGGEAIENALQELDILTQEARRTLLRNQRASTRDSGNRARPSNRATRNVDEDLKVIEEAMERLNELSARGSTFNQWKMMGTLLWIHGKPGSGKTVLCSTIIEDIKRMQEAGTALMACFYFDYKEPEKCNLRDLLSSILLQLGNQSDPCWEILSQLYALHGNGWERPSETALTQCLKDMLKAAKRMPTYIIVDALDECSNTAASTSSPRNPVLDLLQDLANSSNLYPKLRICVTSRPAHYIKDVLEPLAYRSISLHEEVGQIRDIQEYIRHVVNTDQAMQPWSKKDKQLAIDTLSEKADGRFRWVASQLDTLRKCTPTEVRRTLDALPAALEEMGGRPM